MKEEYIQFENSFLSPYAVKSESTFGRQRKELPCPMRTEFQRDRDRILHSKAFRRLKHKTQVFLSPTGDHYRTRLTHTLEVTQIARTISRALKLNEDLTEAIALGHDLGHTPFGHTGERMLHKKTGHFFHNEQSLRIVDLLEDNGAGLNLTFEVRDGILNHRTSGKPMTLEGKVVRVADKIAYLNHDVDDAIRAGLLAYSSIPHSVTALLGEGKGKMINALVSDIVKNSYNNSDIIQSEKYTEEMRVLRQFMFENIYSKSEAKTEEIKADRIISLLFDYFMDNTEYIPTVYTDSDRKVNIKDFIAGMSDNFAIKTFKNIFVPDAWEKK